MLNDRRSIFPKDEDNKGFPGAEYCFACGPQNPVGLHMRVLYEEDRAVCHLSLSKEFQGWDGIVHGGLLATILDEIMAHAIIHFVGEAVTTSLEIKFRAPMHIGEEVEAFGYITQRKSRGVVAKGEIRSAKDSRLIAQAEGKYIFLPEDSRCDAQDIPVLRAKY
nr:PaaI family thioesterase [Desulfobacterales bacterium]